VSQLAARFGGPATPIRGRKRHLSAGADTVYAGGARATGPRREKCGRQAPRGTSG